MIRTGNKPENYSQPVQVWPWYFNYYTPSSFSIFLHYSPLSPFYSIFYIYNKVYYWNLRWSSITIRIIWTHGRTKCICIRRIKEPKDLLAKLRVTSSMLLTNKSRPNSAFSTQSCRTTSGKRTKCKPTGSPRRREHSPSWTS